jgi:hypothetical protein
MFPLPDCSPREAMGKEGPAALARNVTQGSKQDFGIGPHAGREDL